MKTTTAFAGTIFALSACLLLSCNRSKTPAAPPSAADTTAQAAAPAPAADTVSASPSVEESQQREEVKKSVEAIFFQTYFRELTRDQVESRFWRLVQADYAYTRTHGELGYYDFDPLNRGQDLDEYRYTYRVKSVTLLDQTHARASVTVYLFGRDEEGLPVSVEMTREDGKWKLSNVENDLKELQKRYK